MLVMALELRKQTMLGRALRPKIPRVHQFDLYYKPQKTDNARKGIKTCSGSRGYPSAGMTSENRQCSEGH